MRRTLIPAALMSLITISSAGAQPGPAAITAAGHAETSNLVLIQRQRDGNANPQHDNRQRYTPGRRYKNAPPGWNHHGNRRPGNWRQRGCVTVGPIWFCP
ncbi:MAG: hypothetical protein ABL907_25435 [Hyphomicrobium sp.]